MLLLNNVAVSLLAFSMHWLKDTLTRKENSGWAYVQPVSYSNISAILHSFYSNPYSLKTETLLILIP